MEPITISGKQKLEEELNHLIRVEREELRHVLHDARELGDLKENAEYHSAKEKQSLLEGRISHLQAVIGSSEVIDVAKINSKNIVFGATITIQDVEKDSPITIQIVGKEESNKDQGKISYSSPLGKALIGKSEGDTAIVKAPKGDIEYEILKLEYK